MEPANAGGENAADLGDALMRRHSIGIDGVGTDAGHIGHGMETVRNLMSMGGR